MNTKRTLILLSSALLLFLIALAASVYSFVYLDQYPNTTNEEDCPFGKFDMTASGDIRESWVISVSTNACLASTDTYHAVHSWYIARGWHDVTDISSLHENEIRIGYFCINFNKSLTMPMEKPLRFVQAKWLRVNNCGRNTILSK